jgi:hypothetical protein
MWAYDFVFDATAAGQQIKCLTIVDEFTRECLAIDVAGSIRSKRVIKGPSSVRLPNCLNALSGTTAVPQLRPPHLH